MTEDEQPPGKLKVRGNGFAVLSKGQKLCSDEVAA
jgi:hypothetical protein